MLGMGGSNVMWLLIRRKCHFRDMRFLVVFVIFSGCTRTLVQAIGLMNR